MRVLLVHGIGRTPLSMWRLARTLRRDGQQVELFGYLAALESVDGMVARLRAHLEIMAGGEYLVVGHSFGGLLLRAAITGLAPDLRRPRRLIMLGTPNHSPRLARRFERAWWYRLLNGDGGALMAHEARLQNIPVANVPTTIVAGTRGIYGRWSPFGAEPNDGLVALSETQMNGAEEWIVLPLRHPFMMNDGRVRAIVRERCAVSFPQTPAIPRG